MYVLRNVARVSKRFKKLSEDPFLIRKIELHKSSYRHNGEVIRACFNEDPILIREINVNDRSHSFNDREYNDGCFNVLKTSKNLKFISLDIYGYGNSAFIKKFLEESPSSNHQHLEEFQIHGRQDKCGDWEGDSNIMVELMEYLQNCPKLKILKFEYEGEYDVRQEENAIFVDYWCLEYLEENPCGKNF